MSREIIHSGNIIETINSKSVYVIFILIKAKQMQQRFSLSSIPR